MNRPCRRSRRTEAGVVLMELMIALAIVAMLTMVALPMYNKYANRARVSKSIGDIASLQLQVEKFRLRNNDRVPNNLAELGVPIPLDPWQQPYVYLNMRTLKNTGPARKDGRLHPLNTDFDLYSVGADGKSALPLSAKASRDDIVRANNGAFIGLGEDY